MHGSHTPSGTHSLRVLAAVCALALAASATGDEAPYAAGDLLPQLDLKDQHDQARAVDGEVRFLLFSRDMDGGGVIRDALAASDGQLLQDASAVYVADISGMPAFVRRMFALPGLRRRPYPILLDPDGSKTSRIPSAAGKATVLGLTRLRIRDVRFVDSPDALVGALTSRE